MIFFFLIKKGKESTMEICSQWVESFMHHIILKVWVFVLFFFYTKVKKKLRWNKWVKKNQIFKDNQTKTQVNFG